MDFTLMTLVAEVRQICSTIDEKLSLIKFQVISHAAQHRHFLMPAMIYRAPVDVMFDRHSVTHNRSQSQRPQSRHYLSSRAYQELLL
jgi:hypothetical protein